MTDFGGSHVFISGVRRKTLRSRSSCDVPTEVMTPYCEVVSIGEPTPLLAPESRDLERLRFGDGSSDSADEPKMLRRKASSMPRLAGGLESIAVDTDPSFVSGEYETPSSYSVKTRVSSG
uniref:Uncharacterized protein n=1 Tax=Peronospora matthiolae TaxID=2874970 RepID=A0AAV1U3H5_9STRA